MADCSLWHACLRLLARVASDKGGDMRAEVAVLPGEPPLEVVLRPSPQGRRLSLRVSRLDGRVTLSLPARASRAMALDFLREKEPWLRRALADLPTAVTVRPGVILPVEGQMLELRPERRHDVERRGGELLVPESRPALTGNRVAAWLRLLAGARLAAASERYAATLGLGYSAIALRDTRSRWGSCTAQGRLMFSWRLAMAPPAVLDYVAAHEVAHLAEMNHSPAYWAVVARLVPEYARHRAWLRSEGSALHRYRFDTMGD